MSHHARGGFLFLMSALFAVGSIALAQAPALETTVRPLFVWAALAGAFGMLVGLIEMGGPRR
jgi:hypothetical protein